MISIVCNHLSHPCGCSSWMEWSDQSAEWVPMVFRCSRPDHEPESEDAR